MMTRTLAENYPDTPLYKAAIKAPNKGAWTTVVGTPGQLDILEAWDAKYGKGYLREELEELRDKLADKEAPEYVGFITDKTPDLRREITERCAEISLAFGVPVGILAFSDWIDWQIERFGADRAALGPAWLRAVAESIGQKRRVVAPIDEPTHAWVEALIELLA